MGCRWEDIPPELGCSGMTAHRCLRRWEEMGCWDRLHADLLRLLRQAGQTRPRPGHCPCGHRAGFRRRRANRQKPRGPRGKRLQTHAAGGPAWGAAGHPRPQLVASDHRQIIPLVLDFPKVKGKPAGPRSCPTSCTPTEATTATTPAGGGWLGIEPFIAKRRTAHGSGLGKVRWVVERTISWLKGLRRMSHPLRPLGRDPRRLGHAGPLASFASASCTTTPTWSRFC